MTSQSQTKENGEINPSTARGSRDAIELMANVNFEDEDKQKQRAELVEWLNGMLPDLRLPLEASEEEIRACLIDGNVLCSVLDRLRPGSINEGGSDLSSEPCVENVKRFLATMDQMGLPRFRLSDLEQGSMVTVVECLLTLKEHFNSNLGGDNVHITSSMAKSGMQPRKRWKLLEVESSERINGSVGEVSPCGQNTPVTRVERRKSWTDSKFQRVLRSPIMSEPSAALIHHVGHKFQEVFQLKQGRYADIPAAKISEMMKSNSLDNAPTQSLLSVVNGILDESIERKNDEIPHRVACLLRKVVQEIERRISTQAEHLRTQNNLYKAREEKYQSRLRVLETLATGTSEETQVAMNKFQQIKTEKTQMEEKKKLEEQDRVRLMKEKDHSDLEISTLKQELELAKQKYEHRCLQLETQAKGTEVELEERLKELEGFLEDSRKNVEKLESFSESKAQSWNRKEHRYQNFVDLQFKSLQELRFTSQSIKQVVLNTQRIYSKEFSQLGVKLKGLSEVAENYHMVLSENRKLYNEVQDLKGNIRVYCRIRPFLSGQNGKQTTIDFIGENGEMVIVNPLKQGKDSRRLFKFNKVFGPTATQEEVFLDTQPLIRSILDGYNVCIFAYGQTGSGKTYTMTGPDAASKKDWGVNFRALNDLFHISQSRRNSFVYEVGVQMVEIYNEQVRDLLVRDSSQRKLGIWSTAQPNGLAVPDATMHPVKSTGDVLDLMRIGLMNRAVGATAMNERSSRSHSVLTVHVRGTDLATGANLRGNLHLVDLAGSERVDRSEATGERLREAQHINKSLSALGDVIFALAQKSPHVPYRNSKLTQVLQSSLGGQAKTLMFVQLNPDADSYSETLSTLKFAERVSGVELGAARSSKEGRDVRELMEQVASLKDTIAKKDEEIERLQLLRHGPSSPGRRSLNVAAAQQSRRLSGGKGSGLEKGASDQDNCSEHSDKYSEAGSQQSMDDFRHHKEFFHQSKLAVADTGENFSADVELVGFGDVDSEERLSDISDGGLSMGTETDGSISSAVEFTLFPEDAKPAEGIEKSKPGPSKLPKPAQKQVQTGSVRRSSSKETLKMSTSSKNVSAGSSSSTANLIKKWQQN